MYFIYLFILYLLYRKSSILPTSSSRKTKDPSTRIRIFLKTHLFYPFSVSVHTETAFSVTKNESFRKRSPEWIFLKTPFSCSRVDGRKRSFSKTLTSQHRFTTYQSMRTDLWGQQKGILIVCFLLSKFEQRSLNVAASSCGRGYFENAPRVDANLFENG